jgi:uncharacterized protein (TIGR02466 family)
MNDTDIIDNHQMSLLRPFYTPIYSFKFKKHKEYKEKVLNYLEDEELYKKNTRRRTLQFSHPNLHKEPIFEEYTQFFKECIAIAMDDYGHIPEFCMTGLWATKHKSNVGFHHLHTHNNSFFGGVYYFDGDEKAAGTAFYSPHRYASQIVPARNNKPLRNQHSLKLKWEEGRLIIFPAWAAHDTPVNYSEKTRTILSFNVMPLGKTNTDAFDRYNYQDISNAEMINNMDEVDK